MNFGNTDTTDVGLIGPHRGPELPHRGNHAGSIFTRRFTDSNRRVRRVFIRLCEHDDIPIRTIKTVQDATDGWI